MWIVMEQLCGRGEIAVAIVRITQQYTANGWTPKTIARHADGIMEIRHIDSGRPTRTGRGRLHRARERAALFARTFNGRAPFEHPAAVVTMGGSA